MAYDGVTTRFLRKEERLINSSETEMPLVIEAKEHKDLQFLQNFLKTNSQNLMADIAKYGAVLFRGFDIQSDKDFENSLLSIVGLKGISEAFMAEHGRERVDGLKYVLHTNTIYKTGGTLYLGGFHSENYYTADVPGFISFCCLKPSTLGGETGLVNMEKVYEHLDAGLKEKLEKSPFFVEKWLISEVADRYKISPEAVIEVCHRYNLPIEEELILMYKPSVFVNPVTQKKAIAINCFSLPMLDRALRKRFLDDYQGKTWFWHRFVWKLPPTLFKAIENAAVFSIALFHSPKELYQMSLAKWKTNKALKKIKVQLKKVNSCFSEKDIGQLADLMRNFYCSTIWHKGDILLVDNKKVFHAGMPGSGPRLVRALITNPIQMQYTKDGVGCLHCQDRNEGIGASMSAKASGHRETRLNG